MMNLQMSGRKFMPRGLNKNVLHCLLPNPTMFSVRVPDFIAQSSSNSSLDDRETWQLGSVSSTDQVGNECGFENVGSRTLKVMTS